MDVVDMLKSGLNEDEHSELFTLSKTKYWDNEHPADNIKVISTVATYFS